MARDILNQEKVSLVLLATPLLTHLLVSLKMIEHLTRAGIGKLSVTPGRRQGCRPSN